MLDGLDGVPWSSLTHAYGPAKDVPGCLRALADADKEARKNAWHELYGNIWHQGTIYEATPHAVPFLIELAQSQDVPDRHEIIEYLATLSHGTSFIDTHQDYKVLQFDKASPEFQSKLQRELSWVELTHARILDSDHVYERLLNDTDAAVRASAAFLLGNLRGDIERHAEWLRARLRREEDATVRGYILLALGMLPLDQPADCATSTSLLVDATAPLNEKAAAALCLANRMGHASPDTARQALSLSTTDELGAEFDKVAIIRTNVGDIFMEALARAAPVDVLIAAMSTAAKTEQKFAFAAAALLTAFGDYEHVWNKAPLTPLQSSVLHAVTQAPGLWNSESEWNIGYELWRRDLPEHLPELQRLLAGA